MDVSSHNHQESHHQKDLNLKGIFYKTLFLFNNCQYQMIGMLKEDDLLAYLELFKQNPLTDTQKNFLMSARRSIIFSFSLLFISFLYSGKNSYNSLNIG